MLTIRPEQEFVFQQTAQRHFEQEMVAHLKQFAPEQTAAIGDPQVAKAVAHGVKQARNYGFTWRGPVQFYLELLLMLGIDFDTDPQYPWVRTILANTSAPDQLARADDLYEQALSYRQAVIGPNREFLHRALSQVRSQRLDNLPPLGEAFHHEALQRLRAIHPEKCAFMGEKTQRLLVAKCFPLAQQLRLPGPAGAALCLGLSFAMGHGFYHDPLYPWIENTLGNDAIQDDLKRVERLHSKTMTYLDRALST